MLYVEPEKEIALSLTPAVTRMTAPHPRVLVKTNLWFNWAMIAVQHEQMAITARGELKLEFTLRSGSRDIRQEMHPAMVALVACALAFDALHADLAPLVNRNPDPRQKCGRRRQWEYMLDTIKIGLPEAANWSDELAWLIEQRDNAVHFKGALVEPVRHPDLPTSVPPENLQFSKESAGRAVDLLLRILAGLMVGSDPGTHFGEWGRARRHVIAELEAARTRTPRDG
jgi:hypothetical protein